MSQQLEGVASGTPQASSNGEWVFLTHNGLGQSEGHFTILDALMNGTEFYTMVNTTSPFCPPGIYHNPAEGYYDGGQGNTNDILVWSVQPKPNDTVVGLGATFAFQFPIGFDGTNSSSVGYVLLGDAPRPFQAIAPPVLANEGRSLYWGVSRDSYWSWVGAAGVDRPRFSRAPTSFVGFARNSQYPGQAVWAPLALSSNTTAPTLFGGTATTQFVRFNFDLSQNLTVSTNSYVYSQAHVAPDDSVVYYVESAGLIHAADFNTLNDTWTHNLGFQSEGATALTSAGNVLYVADIRGFLVALQVGAIAATPAPVAAPQTPSPVATTSSPVATPAPVASSTPAPAVPAPPVSKAPHSTPTAAPASASKAPTQRTAAPIAAPTSAPHAPHAASPVRSTWKIAFFGSFAVLLAAL